MENKYIPAHGNAYAQLMILGEHPGYDETEAFSSRQGVALNNILKSAGIRQDECWYSYVSKHYIPPSQGKKKIPFQVRAKLAHINLAEQIEDLRREIQSVNPNCILALGSGTLQTLTGKDKIHDYRGSILSSWLGKKVVATYNPKDLSFSETDREISDYWQKQVIIFDFKRAKHQSTFNELILPQRTLTICKSSAQLESFINRWRNAKKLSVDIEAQHCIPICIGLSFDPCEGTTIPLWNHFDNLYISDNELANLWILLAHILNNPTFKKVGQNFKYDQDKITKLGLPIDKLYSDTMFKAFCINPELPKNLAFNVSIHTEEPFYKNEGMYEGSLEDLFIGCARDACVTLEVDNAKDVELDEMGLRPYYEQFLMPLHQLYLEIENEGFNVDTDKRDLLLKKYINWDERLRYELYKATGKYINVNSWKQVDNLLYDQLRIPRRAGTSEEVLTQLLNGPVKDDLRRNVISNILEARRVRKTISGNLTAIRDYDGKVRTTYFLCLETGRSSTSQQEPPIRPSEEVIEIDENGKKKKKKKALGTAFQTMTKHGDIGPEVRSMYVAPPGYCFLQADSSQAEARVIFLLAEDYQALEDIDTHDYHALTASWFFGGKEEDYSKKVLGYESPIRFAGKTLRHAGHLGASARRAAIEVNTQARKYKIDYRTSESETKEALRIFHQKQPKIKGVFQDGIIKCIEKDRRLVSPVPFGINATIGGTRIFYERYGEELFRQAFSYLPQRTVSENTKGAALRIKLRSSWIRIIVESHDALLCAVPVERKLEAACIMKEEFEREIDFSTCSLPRGKLIIPCEIEEGYNYYEMSKFNLW